MSYKATASKGAGSKSASSGGKGKGGHPSKQGKAASKGKVREADLLLKQFEITPEDVLGLEAATEGERGGAGRTHPDVWV